MKQESKHTEDDNSTEGTSQEIRTSRKHTKSSQCEALTWLAAQIVASQISEEQEETWKKQALLFRDQTVAHKLEMLSGMLQRTAEEKKRLLKVVREREVDENDSDDIEELLRLTI
ncbi:hypothetical protein GN244_ATG12978 [Phytophthora infestans]|uniref:Uncharacterized protein n=1 Tax=Phytophthora infestans TaxID=4787 RepID=A0A833T153_PHYIN|nr:hypothetical protein GN244_ATG12978 [Phytophthora infestans]KAF4141812.1 hypothetical protein GN958_ATG09000 [Phytophthora infestans]